MVDEEKILKLSQILLSNQKSMIKEQDIINLCENDEEYKEIIPHLVKNFQNIGVSLIRTSYQGKRYFVLTIGGKDQNITPSMYGTMALLVSLYNEVGEDVSLKELKKLFSNVWSDIEALISANYLHITKDEPDEKIEITPIGKGAFKNIIKELNIKKILEI